jgi:undecaprenyl-diphosphatase
MPDDRDAPAPEVEPAEPVNEQGTDGNELKRSTPRPAGLVGAIAASRRYVSSHALFFIASVIGCSLVVLLTWISSEVYESVKNADGLATLDEPTLMRAVELRTPTNVAVVQFFTNLGGGVWMTVITMVIVATMTIVWRSRTPIVVIGIGAAGSLLMTVVGKDLVGRARPPQTYAIPPYETSPSFPSGHTLNSTVIASLVAYLIVLHVTSILIRILAIVLAAGWFVAMGLSRVFLGHHWLTDVIAGWTLGLAWVAVVIGAHQLFLTVRRDRRQHPVVG